MSRYHLAFEALRRTTRLGARALELMDECRALIARASAQSREYLEDPPEIRDWVWTAP
jgi:xylulose-5-phosphate/fructose-6-phosphate phosphoketolase